MIVASLEDTGGADYLALLHSPRLHQYFSAVSSLFTPLSSILPVFRAAASLFNLRQLVK